MQWGGQASFKPFLFSGISMHQSDLPLVVNFGTNYDFNLSNRFKWNNKLYINQVKTLSVNYYTYRLYFESYFTLEI